MQGWSLWWMRTLKVDTSTVNNSWMHEWWTGSTAVTMEVSFMKYKATNKNVCLLEEAGTPANILYITVWFHCKSSGHWFIIIMVKHFGCWRQINVCDCILDMGWRQKCYWKKMTSACLSTSAHNWKIKAIKSATNYSHQVFTLVMVGFIPTSPSLPSRNGTGNETQQNIFIFHFLLKRKSH